MATRLKKEYQITLMDALVFLMNIEVFPSKDGIDADTPARELKALLSKERCHLDQRTLEKLAYFCNMNLEEGRFCHPNNEGFKTMMLKILSSDEVFDPTYNRIVRNEQKQKR